MSVLTFFDCRRKTLSVALLYSRLLIERFFDLPSERIFNLVALNPCLHFLGAGASISTSLVESSTSEDPDPDPSCDFLPLLNNADLVFDRVTRPGPA